MKGALGFLRSLHTRFKASDYRVAYEVVENALDLGQGVLASISIFDHQAAAARSNRLSAVWVKENLDTLLPNL